MLPVFKRSEDYEHGADEFHGAGGELRVEERRVSWEILDAWRDAAEECGIPKIAEFNRGDNFGNAYFQMNQRRGVRWSATKAFLRPVLKRPNLTVRTGALVERVAIETRDGVRARDGRRRALRAAHGTQTLRARREVLLAAGSIGSPQILQLSGVGPGAAAARARHRRRGRRCPASARTCTITLQIRSIYKVRNTRHAESPRAHVARQSGDGARVRVVPHRAALTMPPSQLGAFAKSDDGASGREHRVARAAVVARQVRLAAARVRCDHAVGLQSCSRRAAATCASRAPIRPRIRRSR